MSVVNPTPQAKANDSLLGNQSGAMLVIGVFMAIFLTAMLAYAAALGQSVWYRERLQDAADGTAISSAILLARSMNLVVLVNLIMEALVMIVLILQILVTVIGIVALILAACFLYPAAAAMVQLGYQVYDVSSEVKDIVVEDVLPILNKLEQVIRVAGPVLAEIDSISNSKEDYGDVVDFGFLIPTRLTLPIEAGKYSDICGKAARDLGEAIGLLGVPSIIAKAIGKALQTIVEPLTFWFCGGDFDEVTGLLTDGASGLSGFDTGAAPPTTERKYSYDYPEYTGREECINAMRTLQLPCEDGQTGAAAKNCVHADPCGKYYKEGLVPAKPTKTGGCSQADSVSNCEKGAQDARSQCNPVANNKVQDYMYSTGEVSEKWVWDGDLKQWVEDRSARRVTYDGLKGQRPEMTSAAPGAFEFSEDPIDRMEDDNYKPNDPDYGREGNPCQGYWNAYDGSDRWRDYQEPAQREWNLQRFAKPEDEGKQDLVVPVCSAPKDKLPDPTEPHKDGDVFPRKYKAVMDVYMCAEERKDQVEIVNFDKSEDGVGGFSQSPQDGQANRGGEQQQQQNSNSDDKAPYLVEKKLFLGDDDFMVRSIIVGHELKTKNSALIAARWGSAEKQKERVLEWFGKISRFSVAQAEFYFEPPSSTSADGKFVSKVDIKAGTRDEWMWNMFWKARLTHFTLPFIGGSGGETGRLRMKRQLQGLMYADALGTLGNVAGNAANDVINSDPQLKAVQDCANDIKKCGTLAVKNGARNAATAAGVSDSDLQAAQTCARDASRCATTAAQGVVSNYLKEAGLSTGDMLMAQECAKDVKKCTALAAKNMAKEQLDKAGVTDADLQAAQKCAQDPKQCATSTAKGLATEALQRYGVSPEDIKAAQDCAADVKQCAKVAAKNGAVELANQAGYSEADLLAAQKCAKSPQMCATSAARGLATEYLSKYGITQQDINAVQNCVKDYHQCTDLAKSNMVKDQLDKLGVTEADLKAAQLCAKDPKKCVTDAAKGAVTDYLGRYGITSDDVQAVQDCATDVKKCATVAAKNMATQQLNELGVTDADLQAAHECAKNPKKCATNAAKGLVTGILEESGYGEYIPTKAELKAIQDCAKHPNIDCAAAIATMAGVDSYLPGGVDVKSLADCAKHPSLACARTLAKVTGLDEKLSSYDLGGASFGSGALGDLGAGSFGDAKFGDLNLGGGDASKVNEAIACGNKPSLTCAKAFISGDMPPSGADVAEFIKGKIMEFFGDGAIALCTKAMEAAGVDVDCQEVYDTVDQIAQMIGH